MQGVYEGSAQQLWVGSLLPTASPATLSRVFGRYGSEPLEVKLHPDPDGSAVFAFVTLPTEAAEAALRALAGTCVPELSGDRPLLVRVSRKSLQARERQQFYQQQRRPQPPYPQKQQQARPGSNGAPEAGFWDADEQRRAPYPSGGTRQYDETEPTDTLWVGSIREDAMPEEVQAVFFRYGTVQHVALHLAAGPTPNYQYAFVRMGSEGEAAEALKALAGAWPEDISSNRPIKVRFTRSRHFGPGGGRASPPGPPPPGFETERRPARAAWAGSSTASSGVGAEAPGSTTSVDKIVLEPEDLEGASRHLWLGNCEVYPNDRVLRQVFGRFGEIENTVTFPGKLYAFVHFYDVEAAAKAFKALNQTRIPQITAGRRLLLDFHYYDDDESGDEGSPPPEQQQHKPAAAPPAPPLPPPRQAETEQPLSPPAVAQPPPLLQPAQVAQPASPMQAAQPVPSPQATVQFQPAAPPVMQPPPPPPPTRQLPLTPPALDLPPPPPPVQLPPAPLPVQLPPAPPPVQLPPAPAAVQPVLSAQHLAVSLPTSPEALFQPNSPPPVPPHWQNRTPAPSPAGPALPAVSAPAEVYWHAPTQRGQPELHAQQALPPAPPGYDQPHPQPSQQTQHAPPTWYEHPQQWQQPQQLGPPGYQQPYPQQTYQQQPLQQQMTVLGVPAYAYPQPPSPAMGPPPYSQQFTQPPAAAAAAANGPPQAVRTPTQLHSPPAPGLKAAANGVGHLPPLSPTTSDDTLVTALQSPATDSWAEQSSGVSPFSPLSAAPLTSSPPAAGGEVCAGCGSPGTASLRLRNCSSCRQVGYCSTRCQLKDWQAGHLAHCPGLHALSQLLEEQHSALELLQAALEQPQGSAAAALSSMVSRMRRSPNA